jgi:two-component system NarL family sensor kinase
MTGGPVGPDPTTDLESSDADSPATPFAGEASVTTHETVTDAGQDNAADDVSWRTIATPEREVVGDEPMLLRRVVAQLALGIIVVLVVVTVGGAFAARRLAEREAVNDAANIADLFAESVIRPAVTDKLAAGDGAARASFDDLVKAHVLGPSVVHVKLWTPQGRVLYADESELIGQTFKLDDDQRSALEDPQTRADISNLDRDENTLDRSASSKLVEVYRPVWTPTGKELLFEIYAPYNQVSQRTSQLWRGFAGVTLSSLLLFLVLLTPLFWHLTSRVRRNQKQRELLLQRSVDASSNERRLIAASLHDGPVQDLAATSFVVAGATARAKAAGQNWLVDELQNVAGSVRASIRALRSLLVDIYPASLTQAGLGAALADLVQSVRAPGLEVRLHHDDEEELGLTPEQERLVYRVAQETLRNAAKHAVPCTASVTLYRVGDEVVLDVLDDGNGFDVDAQLANPEPGHFGLHLLADIAATGGALLQVASVPRRGTHWRLRVAQAQPAGLTQDPNPTHTEPEDNPDD